MTAYGDAGLAGGGPRLTRRTLPGFLDRLFDGFDAVFRACPEPDRYRIGGQVYALASALPDYRRIAREGLHGADETAPAPDCRVIVAVAGSLGLPAAPRWAEPFYAEREVEAALAATRYRVHHMLDLGFWQFHDRETGRGIQLMSAPSAHPPWEEGSPLRNFVHWHLAGRRAGLIHAGTLGLGGQGVLLAGPGGSGKSGTVLGGLLHGLDSVGDDYVLVRLDGDLRVEPVFAVTKQDPAGLARLGAAIPEGEVNWQGKHLLRLDQVGHLPPEGGLRPRALLLPRVSGEARTRISPATAKEGFLALAPSGVSQIPGDRNANFALCAEVSRRLPCFRLDLGTDPHEVSARLRAFIAEGVSE